MVSGSIVNKLIQSALKSKLTHKHCAVGVYKGRIITPYIHNVWRTFVFSTLVGSRHAEIGVLYNIIKQDFMSVRGRHHILQSRHIQKKLKSIDIIVIRTNIQGTLLYSKPCASCLHTMKELGIRNVIFSTADNLFTCFRVKSLISSHISQMGKYITP